jgi:hypothetical protein
LQIPQSAATPSERFCEIPWWIGIVQRKAAEWTFRGFARMEKPVLDLPVGIDRLGKDQRERGT